MRIKVSLSIQLFSFSISENMAKILALNVWVLTSTFSLDLCTIYVQFWFVWVMYDVCSTHNKEKPELFDFDDEENGVI